MVTLSGRIAVLRAVTSLHPGAGAAVGAIDLPIQREKHTSWPMMQSGGVKGVFRDAARAGVNGPDPDRDPDLTAVFGPTTADAGEYAGALVVSDARVLLFPVRSLKGVCAMVTCPSALRRYAADQKLAGLTPISPPNQEPASDPAEAWCTDSQALFYAANGTQQAVLADVALRHESQNQWSAIAPALATLAEESVDRLVVVADDIFSWFVRFHTEVIARNSLDDGTKTVKRGALWNEEYLPPQTVMYSVLLADRVYSSHPVDVLAKSTEWIDGKVLQFGGDASTGKGLCRVTLIGG